MHSSGILYAIAAIAMASGVVKGEDTTRMVMEHPCGGSGVVQRPVAATLESTVKADDILPLLTRAIHRLNDIRNIYASERIRSEAIVRKLRRTSIIHMMDINPNFGTATEVRNKVDNVLQRLQEELMTQIVMVDHIRRDEQYWAGNHPRELAFRETTYAWEVSQVQDTVLMPIACLLHQITTSRGITIDASATQRMKEIQYSYPQSQYLSDMRAFYVFNSLHKLILKSRIFFNVIRKAALL